MSSEPIPSAKPGATAQAPVATSIDSTTTSAQVPPALSAQSFNNAAALDSITPPLKELHTDYVLEVKLSESKEKDAEISQQISSLVDLLSTSGFFVQVHPGATATVLSPGSVFIMVRLAQLTLVDQHLISSVQDYTNGVQKLLPTGENLSAEFLDSKITPAERLRLIYSRLTDPASGLGITPGIGKWAFVSQIFPIHNYNMNEKWISRWTHKLLIDSSEITWLRSQFGERVAMYFAYLQHYFLWLTAPAAVGLFVHLFIGSYSMIFTIFNVVWAVLFLSSWSTRENSLALTWGTKGVSAIEKPRPEFVPEKWVKDPVSNKTVPTASYWVGTVKQLATVPMILSAAGIVVSLQTLALSLEIFFAQAYTGPLKFVLKFAPTVVLAAVIPVVIAIYGIIVKRVINWENHRTQNGYSYSFNQKLFTISLLVSTGNLFLTAFVYLPFGHRITPHLTFLTQYVNSLVGTNIADPKGFIVNGSRLQAQVLYMMVTAQIIAFFTDSFVPTIVRKVTAKVEEFKTGESAKPKSTRITPDELFLYEIREQAPLAKIDIDAEYQKMIIQLAFVVIFGSVWPLAALASLINNFLEFRVDARKIVIDCQRPIPQRQENIGKYWLKDISIITWIAAIVGPVLSVMYGTCGHHLDSLMIHNLNKLSAHTTGYLGLEKVGSFEATADKVSNSFGSAHVHAPPRTILLTLLLSEHSYFLLKAFVEFVYAKITTDSQESVCEAKEEHDMREEVVALQLNGNKRALQLIDASIRVDKNADRLSSTDAPSSSTLEPESIKLEKLPEGTADKIEPKETPITKNKIVNHDNLPELLTPDEPAPESIEKMWMEIQTSAQSQVQSVIKTQLDTYTEKKEKKAREEKSNAKAPIKKD